MYAFALVGYVESSRSTLVDPGEIQERNQVVGTERQSSNSLQERMPPHAIEAEASLLGSILIDPDVCGDVLQIIRSPEDFFRQAHGEVYRVICELYDRHQAVDIVQLQQLLKDRDILKPVGGTDFLVELAESVPDATSASHYARLIREKAMVRQLIAAAGEILREAHARPESATALIDEAERRIFQIAEQSETRKISELSELITEAMALIEKGGGAVAGVSSGYREFDEMTGGMQPGEMIILAARPSMGKTALALNIAENIAIRGDKVGFFSLEMSSGQIVQRLLSSRSGVSGQALRRNALHQRDFQALFAACDELRESPIYIDDTPGLTLMQLRAKARRMKQKFDINCLLIDYLQLMTSGGRSESRQQEVSELSRGVKALARELNVPVMALSQLNRAAEQREGHRPRMSDLRESGSIEQDADVVMMLHREEYFHRDEAWIEANPDKRGLAELIIAKQRNGPTGTVKLSWNNATTRFRDYAPMESPAGSRVVDLDDGGLPV